MQNYHAGNKKYTMEDWAATFHYIHTGWSKKLLVFEFPTLLDAL